MRAFITNASISKTRQEPHDVRRYGGCDLEEAKMWLAGDPMDPDREIPTQTKWEREGW